MTDKLSLTRRIAHARSIIERESGGGIVSVKQETEEAITEPKSITTSESSASQRRRAKECFYLKKTVS